MAFYQPPARIDDYSRSPRAAELAADWDDHIGGLFRDRNRNLFYDAATDNSPGEPVGPAPVPWNGFPRSIWQFCNADSDPDGIERALLAAETLRPFVFVRSGGRTTTRTFRPGDPPMFYYDGQNLLPDPVVLFDRQQDEYLEWHVDRDETGGITRISFSAEAPDYWRQMAAIDLDLVTNLYQEHVNPAVANEDLVWPFDVAVPDFDRGQYVLLPGSLRRGQYNPHNRWNTRNGVMHLTHPANTIGGQINLAFASTTLFPEVPAQPAATYPSRLLCCTRFGGENRSSDPQIVSSVNLFAQQGLAVTIANPVGLYISTLDIDGLADPEGRPIPQALRITRQSDDGSMILRAVIEPPPGAGYTLDACTFDQEPLRFGGQIARKITLLLFGLAKAIPEREAESSACRGKCCSKSDAPGFQQSFAPETLCAELPETAWDEVAPYFPPPEPAPGEVVEASLEASLKASPKASLEAQPAFAEWRQKKVTVAEGATLPLATYGRG